MLKINHKSLFFTSLVALVLVLKGTVLAQAPGNLFERDKFRQLEETLPTPNAYRAASGAPGSEYWQQRADYIIDVELDDEKQHLTGSEQIHYFNNSPDILKYLWVQIDNNIFSPDSQANKISHPPSDPRRLSFRGLQRLLMQDNWDGGVKITSVKDARENDLPHTIVGTMMRIDLPQPLRSGESVKFSIDWNYAINDATMMRARTGYEYFEKDKNYIYEIAHWFPRMASYTDVHGWANKQFLGRGEFTLEFGDYLVRITAPSDHVVAATGVLQNPGEVLTKAQRKRLEDARTAKTPIYVITPEEALENEKSRSKEKKTWVFHGQSVRDFAWASSRKFIWDAQLHSVDGNETMAMSYFPNEGDPLWSKYSTHSIIHTLNVYSRYTFVYPYPIAISVNGPVYGMEYPMICFNGPRPEKDGTYSAGTKYGLISVIIHEVGHNYFPMIVNSDERRWTWMDEGLNTFLQYLTEQEWEEKYPSRRGEPKDIVGYMRSKNQVPIMTHSEAILQFGANAYAKPATALNILRETILGRELFDFAFKEFSQRWMFKRPQPSDFFRTMEDASGVDLDWFWRGWFYSTDHTDIAITDVHHYQVEKNDPVVKKTNDRKERDARPKTLSNQRNKPLPKYVDKFPELKDFYNSYDRLDLLPEDKKAYEKFTKDLKDYEKKILEKNYNLYVIDFENIGGLVMPLIVELHYTDGTKEEVRIPAEIWQLDPKETSKLFIREKELKSVVLDPHLETADINLDNNTYPPQITPSRFQLFKYRRRGGSNPMRAQIERDRKAKEAEKKKANSADKKTEDKSF